MERVTIKCKDESGCLFQLRSILKDSIQIEVENKYMIRIVGKKDGTPFNYNFSLPLNQSAEKSIIELFNNITSEILILNQYKL